MAYTPPKSVSADDRRIAEEVWKNPEKYSGIYFGDTSKYPSSVGYHLPRYMDVDGGGSGGGRGSGRGGGYGGGRVPLNLKVYKRGKWDTTGLDKRARTRADAKYRDAMFATERQRMDAENSYGKAIREMDLSQERDTRNNAMQRDAALAANANTALNRGMGYGGGYLQTQTNARTGYDRMLNDLLDQYAVQRAGFLDDRNNIYAQASQQDYINSLNRQAWLEEFLQSLEDSSWNRYMGTEGLRQAEIDSANNAIRGKAGV